MKPKAPLEYGDRVRFTNDIIRALAPKKGTVVGFVHRPVAAPGTPGVVEILWDDGERSQAPETELRRVK